MVLQQWYCTSQRRHHRYILSVGDFSSSRQSIRVDHLLFHIFVAYIKYRHAKLDQMHGLYRGKLLELLFRYQLPHRMYGKFQKLSYGRETGIKPDCHWEIIWLPRRWLNMCLNTIYSKSFDVVFNREIVWYLLDQIYHLSCISVLHLLVSNFLELSFVSL